MATNQPPPTDRHRDSPPPAGSVADRARTAQLRARIAVLERALERERQRRRAVITRYERLLDARTRDARGEVSDPDAGLLDRLRR